MKKIMRGQSLFEVVFSIGIAAIILTGIVSVAATSVRNSTYSRNNAQATKYAQEAVEWLRGERDDNWSVFTSRATGTKNLGDLTWSGGRQIGGTIFERRVEFGSAGGTITATVIVEWTDAQGTHEVRSVTQFTNWRVRT